MSQDPYRYFRIEARELLEGLSAGALELERGQGGAARVAALLRLAHTLKGAARVVKQPGIAESAHALESALEPYRAGAAPAAAVGGELLRLCDAIAAELQALGAAAPGEAKPAAPALPEPAAATPPVAESADHSLDSVRVDVEEVNALLAGLTEGAIQLAALRRQSGAVEEARRLARQLLERAEEGDKAGAAALAAGLERLDRGLGAGLARVERELGQAQARAEQLRLTSAQAMFPALARAARDVAAALGKQVECRLRGGEVRLEAEVWVRLRQALLHLINNAVAHGLESPAARQAAGKPPAGRLDLTVERAGTEMVVRCRDDGAGLDLGAVRRRAAERGLLPPGQAAALSESEAIALLLRGGLSTAAAISHVSGRGVGLDVVRAAAESLRGAVRIGTAPGRGVSVEIRFPVSLSALPALLLESGAAVAALPVEAARQVLQLEESALAPSGGGVALEVEGAMLPYVTLAQVLGLPGAAAPRGRRPAVVVAAGERRMVLGVERLHGLATVVMHRLPEEAAAAAVVAGASLDGEGNPRLLLDPAALVELAAGARRAPAVPPAAPARAPILVIDDSLTTRMLEQSILEAAGHRVEVASSAEEALEKAARTRYSLFLVDVEMPGMNGFEFVARTRADARLRAVPAILVTSLHSPADRLRGAQAGACAYIVKSEFDQNRLLAAIREQVGEA